MRYIVDIEVDGYGAEAERAHACEEFVYSQLDISSVTSLKVERLTPKTLAAEEMYEALKDLVDLADTAETSGGISNSDLYGARKLIAAIAKAEGE